MPSPQNSDKMTPNKVVKVEAHIQDIVLQPEQVGVTTKIKRFVRNRPILPKALQIR